MDRIALPTSPDSIVTVRFEDQGGVGDRVHLLSIGEIHAVNAAIAAGRPLLVRGEPGTGKSQLARAAARQLGRVLVQQVIDSRTEARDLMWTFDAIRRLADAQLAGALREDAAKARAALAIKNYLHPGPLWWAFDWRSAEQQAKRVGELPPPQSAGADPANGCVILLDEIDKAEAEVPNGLLEALGARAFTPFGRREPVRAVGAPPLVVITTNEERALPDAFLRRCLVLHLTLPESSEDLTAFLIERGHAHFPDLVPAVLTEAARLLVRDRREAIEKQLQPRPGQAEYLDLLRAVGGLAPGSPEGQIELLDLVSGYALHKHAGIEP